MACVRYQRRRGIPAPFPLLNLSRLRAGLCPATSFRESVTRILVSQQAAGSFLAGLVAGPSELHFELWGSLRHRVPAAVRLSDTARFSRL